MDMNNYFENKKQALKTIRELEKQKIDHATIILNIMETYGFSEGFVRKYLKLLEQEK